MVEAFHQELWRHLNRPTSPVTAEREDQYTQFLAEQWGLVDHYATIYGDPFLYPGKIHCQLCRTIHLRFKFGNLHPLLRFLANSEIRFRGRASTLTLKFTYQYRLNFQVEEDISVRRYAKHAMSEMKWFASQLYAVHLAIQRCGIGSALISSPTCTRLVVLDYEVPNHYRDLRNENGITLKVTVVAMIKRLESYYYTHVSHARSCVRQ
jgi:hypothetical protein